MQDQDGGNNPSKRGRGRPRKKSTQENFLSEEAKTRVQTIAPRLRSGSVSTRSSTKARLDARNKQRRNLRQQKKQKSMEAMTTNKTRTMENSSGLQRNEVVIQTSESESESGEERVMPVQKKQASSTPIEVKSSDSESDWDKSDNEEELDDDDDRKPAARETVHSGPLIRNDAATRNFADEPNDLVDTSDDDGTNVDEKVLPATVDQRVTTSDELWNKATRICSMIVMIWMTMIILVIR